MSLINDYLAGYLTDQRQRDLAAQAANHRLIKIARSGRQTWWQRVLGSADHRIQWRIRQPRAARAN